MGACEESSDTLNTTSTLDPAPKSTAQEPQSNYDYVIVDTGQKTCYDNSVAITYPEEGEAFYGQDAQYAGAQPNYRDNGDGTVTDLNTGLMWQQDPGEKMTYDEAVAGADTFNLAGYNDWRLSTIKELYSLIEFSGLDPSGYEGNDTSGLIPFIDTDYFVFEYGDESAGERIIDSQYASSTKYVNTTMNGDETVFGVNFADGRIKGYGLEIHGSEKTFFVMYVRGNTDYGVNDFVDNGDGTIIDNATGLMWPQTDSGEGMAWEEALEWVQEMNEENYLGYSDWRLPDAKELQSIVDYTRSPTTTNSAAIDPVFECTSIIDEGGEMNYPFYWTSTTHANMMGGGSAIYITFGEALGWMQSPFGGDYTLMDVHGAGAQRSDPKIGDPDDYPYGYGPQGDVIRIDNFVRLVRGGDNEVVTGSSAPEENLSEKWPSGRPPQSGTPFEGGLPGREPGQGGMPGGMAPPQEAINVCSDSSEGTPCEFESPRGTVIGTCMKLEDECICVPEGGPPRGGP
ncbi:MAG: DUF1566 domain-containing protein [Chloroflexi bacterium]|nr:DUF1566 domain-containing protein [Chloroflexota bacterium]